MYNPVAGMLSSRRVYVLPQNVKIMCAQQKGIIKLRGTLGGLTFYEAQGENLVKTISSVSKDRILQDPDYKRTRENMAEFGGSAKAGKAFRMGFANVAKLMGDRYLTGRLTGLMKRINTLGAGARGERSINILPNKEVLENFEFNPSSSLGAVFFAPNTITADANRNVLTWSIPDFNTDNYINAPEGATHFTLVLAAAVLSDYTFVNPGLGYEPTNPAENETNGLMFSSEIPLGGMVGSATTLTVNLGFASALPATVGVLVAVGVVFYQEVNGNYYELASDNAMRIGLVA
jgi:hypothetical protein